MTRVYKPEVIQGFQWCAALPPATAASLGELINGVPRLTEWEPPDLEFFHEGGEGPGRTSDSPWMNARILVFRESVLERLGGNLDTCGELLPARSDQGPLWLYNVTRVLDALDEEASSLRRFKSSGKIMYIDRYELLPAAVEGVFAFKIAALKNSHVLVSGAFVDSWEASGLEGLRFKLVWQDE